MVNKSENLKKSRKIQKKITSRGGSTNLTDGGRTEDGRKKSSCLILDIWTQDGLQLTVFLKPRNVKIGAENNNIFLILLRKQTLQKQKWKWKGFSQNELSLLLSPYLASIRKEKCRPAVPRLLLCQAQATGGPWILKQLDLFINFY